MEYTPSVLKSIDRLYRPTLQNLNVSNPKALILFSGPPSSGKSTVAKVVAKRFKAIRLENDAIRLLATELFPELTLQQKTDLCHAYMNMLWPELIDTVPNGLFVIDSSIDRQYKQVFNTAKRNGLKTILFAMQIPEELHKKWIVNVGDVPYASSELRLANMATMREDQARFLEHHTPDMFLGPDYKIDDVFRLIDSRLKEK